VVRLLDSTSNRTVKREGDEQDWWVLAAEATAAVRDLEILLRTFNPDLRFADPDISRLSIDHYQVRYLADVAKRSTEAGLRADDLRPLHAQLVVANELFTDTGKWRHQVVGRTPGRLPFYGA
jgi:hypothetical protein